MADRPIKAAKFIAPPSPSFAPLATNQEHQIIVGQKKARFMEFGEGLFLPGSACPLSAEAVDETVRRRFPSPP